MTSTGIFTGERDATGDRPVRRQLSRYVLVIALVQFVVLVMAARGYGYHRDEMYFIVCGAHPAWGYPDQPSIVPFVAWTMNWLAPGSLTVLRLPSALLTAVTALLAGLIAREVGGGGRAQVVAAACTAVSGFALAVGHIVSTTTFDLFSTTLLLWLLLRGVRSSGGPSLLLAGIVAGLGFEAKPQVALVAVVALLALVTFGPRAGLRSWWFAGGVVAAVAIAAPYVIWQSAHGWPQLTVAGNVAGTAEGGRIGFVPFQFLLVSPVLAPVWIAGLVAPWRRASLRSARFLPVTYGVLALLYLVANGKAYYLASFYPALLGIGSLSTADWLRRGRARARHGVLVTAVVLSALVAAVIALPVTPTRDLQGGVAMAINPDLGEEVGWPRFVDTVAAAWRAVPRADRRRTAIFTVNYGEASEVVLFGAGHGLPRAYSGQNAYSEWGPPPDRDTYALLLGYERSQAGPYFRGCSVLGRINDGVGLDNQEQGLPVLFCHVTRPWSAIWRQLRHYD